MHSASNTRRTDFIVLFGAIALFIAGVAPATAASDAAPQRTLVVSGEGKATAVPDQALLTAGVLTEAKSAAAALAENSQKMNAVMAALKSAGIADKSIRTSHFSIAPTYGSDPKTGQRLFGYQATNHVTVTLNDLSKVGHTIDALVSAGSNSMAGVSFTFADAKPLAAKARREAVADAVEKAKTMAQAAGVTLGPIMTIQDGGSWTHPPQPMMMMRAEAAATPMSPGEEDVTASVTLTYRIE